MAAIKLKFGFIPFPLAIVDDAADLSLGEYRLLGYLLRHQFRVKTDVVHVSQDELLRGVFGPSGRRYDRGCGITSPRDLKAARVALEARGWLKVTTTTAGMSYELCLAPDDDEEDAVPVGQPSAKCTEETAPSPVQIAPAAECNLSTFPVQNALADIRKERSEKVKRESTPQPPSARGASGVDASRSKPKDNGNGQGKDFPCEGKSGDVGAEAAVAKVLRECRVSNPRYAKLVFRAMDQEHARTDGPVDWNATAEALIAMYSGYLAQTELMRYPVGFRKFVTEGLWLDTRKWAWDEAKVAANQRARVGTSRQGSGAQASEQVAGWKEIWERERAEDRAS